MSKSPLDRMLARARDVRTRAAVRRWQYRQRHHAAGVWYRLRRVLADAQTAYVISDEDARRLVAEGHTPEMCGGQVTPEKLILFVDERRLASLESRRPIPVGLGSELLAAPAIALIAFPHVRQ